MCVVFVYSEDYTQFDYGRHHPLRLFRLKLAFDLMKSYGLLDAPAEMVKPPLASEEVLVNFHSIEYLEALRCAEEKGELHPQHGLGGEENPVFPGVYTFSRLVVGGTFYALQKALQNCRVFHIGGGMHHAKANKAEGFCYLNDVVIALKEAQDKGLRVFYLDIDAHHCDAVQEAFYDSDKVLVVSFHQYEEGFYPGTGSERELGEGAGYGYNINIPLDRYTDDEALWWAFNEIIPALFENFKPDLLFTQLGVDAHKDDPLTNLFLTTGSYKKIAEFLASSWRGPWVAVGGGGYDIINVARIWTIFWAYMLGKDLPEILPEWFLRISRMEGYDGPHIEDLPGWSGEKGHVPFSLKERVKFLKKTSPLLKKV